MNKATRVLVMSGMALFAGATMGAGSASASPKSPDAPAPTVQAAKTVHGWDNDRVVGYYYNRGICFRIGHLGEIRNRWDDFSCDYQRRGFHRGQFELSVSQDRRGGDWNDRNRGHDRDRGDDRRRGDERNRGNTWNKYENK